MDQIALLQFVKDNIYSYGGDPTNITVWGQGSGANSIMYHIFNPVCKNLFHRAIMHSYGNIYDVHSSKKQLGTRIGDSLVGQGLNQVLRLRHVPANKLNNAYTQYLFRNGSLNLKNCFMPREDGVTVFNRHTTPPNKVPIIMGIHNQDSYFLYKMGFHQIFQSPFTEMDMSGNDIVSIKEEYNILTDFNSHPVRNRYLEDILFKYPLLDFMNNHGLRVYPYVINFRMNDVMSYYESEMKYLHHTKNYKNIPYYRIVRIFKNFLLSFIKFGDPNRINKGNAMIESTGNVLNVNNTSIFYKKVDISRKLLQIFHKYFRYDKF
jgi:carboxylesterase type B